MGCYGWFSGEWVYSPNEKSVFGEVVSILKKIRCLILVVV